MITAPALPCPCCQRVLGPESWTDAQRGSCFRCRTDFEFVAFPALHATSEPIAAQPAVLAEDSVCFFHGENRAEIVCEGCGRLLCRICTVPFAGRNVCPSCIAASTSSGGPGVVRERILYDGIAMSLAIIPVLLWPFTAVSAPAALGMVIYGWNKPGSLVRGRSRMRLVIAGTIALIQIAAWITVLLFVWLRR